MVSRFFLWLAAACTALPAWCAENLLLEAQLEPARVYVQAQTIYRLRLYQAVDVRDLDLVGPSSRVADVRLLDGARVYEAMRDGRRYRVHERSYAVFPFASGTLELTGAHATGRVAAADGRRTVRIDARPQTLTVMPAPEASGPWLPAQSLTLSEAWSAAPGGAHRRTIRIEAAGIEAAQLPELRFTAAGSIVHAESPRLENRFSDERNIGTREQSFIVASASTGPIRVPAMKLQWWNTGSGMFMTASLPAITLQGSADAQPAQTGSPAPPVSSLLPGAGMLLAAAAFGIYRKRETWRLLLACSRRDIRAVRDGLLAWSAAVWPDTPPRTLAALAARMRDPATRDAIHAMERSMYGPRPASLDAAALRILVRRVKRDGRRAAAMMR